MKKKTEKIKSSLDKTLKPKRSDRLNIPRMEIFFLIEKAKRKLYRNTRYSDSETSAKKLFGENF